jgi:hypothetical protein
MGRDAKRDVIVGTRTQVMDVFASKRNFEKFALQMIRSPVGDIEHAALLLNAFLQEMRT